MAEVITDKRLLALCFDGDRSTLAQMRHTEAYDRRRRCPYQNERPGAEAGSSVWDRKSFERDAKTHEPTLVPTEDILQFRLQWGLNGSGGILAIIPVLE